MSDDARLQINSPVWPLTPDRQKLVLCNAHRLLRKQFKNMPLWSFISEMTGHGSNYSASLCLQLGWNPDQDASIAIKVYG